MTQIFYTFVEIPYVYEYLNNDKSPLDQIMVWYQQGTSHHIDKSWSRSVTPCGVSNLQCINGTVYICLNDPTRENLFVVLNEVIETIMASQQQG